MDRLCFWKFIPPQAQLKIFSSANYWRAKILRDIVINAFGNLKTIEANSRKAYCSGNQSEAQEKNMTAFHCAQLQRLAALANKHAQLCYKFVDTELLFANLGLKEDPTTQRALKGCYNELNILQFDFLAVRPDTQHPHVVAVIKKWYSPACTCTETEFHSWVYQEHIYLDALADYEKSHLEAEL
jgi:hypothetical protein